MKKLNLLYCLFFFFVSAGITICCNSMAHAENNPNSTHINFNETKEELAFKKFALGLSGGYSYPHGEYNNLKSGYDWGAELTYYVTAHTGFKIGWERLGFSYGTETFGVDTPPWDIRYRLILSEKTITPYRINIGIHYLHNIGIIKKQKACTHFDIGFGHYRMEISSRQSIIDDSTGIVYSNNHDYAKSRIAFEMGGGLLMHVVKEFALDFGLMLSYNISGRTEDMILTAPVGQASSLYYSSGIPKFDGIMSTKLGLIWFF
jgi:hypothetical protein